MREARRPTLFAVGGCVACGKSTLARELAAAWPAALLVADEVRDELVEREAHRSHEAAWPRHFDPGLGDRIYATLLRRARRELAAGRSVVLDGCFALRARRRAAYALAQELGCAFRFVECRAPEAVQRERLRERARRDGLPDEAWLAIRDELQGHWEAVDGEEGCVQVDTSAALEVELREVLEGVE